MNLSYINLCVNLFIIFLIINVHSIEGKRRKSSDAATGTVHYDTVTIDEEDIVREVHDEASKASFESKFHYTDEQWAKLKADRERFEKDRERQHQSEKDDDNVDLDDESAGSGNDQSDDSDKRKSGKRRREDVTMCDIIRRRYEEVGFFSANVRTNYCNNDCTWAEHLDCGQSTDPRYDFIHNVVVMTEKLSDLFKDVKWDNIGNEALPELWLLIFWRFGFACSILIPLLMQAHSIYNFWWALLFVISATLSWLMGFSPTALTAYNVYMDILILINPGAYNQATDSLSTLALMFILLGAQFVNGFVVQIMLLMIGVVAWIVYLNHLFFTKTSSNATAITPCVFQVLVMMEQFVFLRTSFGARSTIVGSAFEMALSTIIPSGSYHSLVVNCTEKAVGFSNYFGDIDAYALLVVVTLMLQLFMFLLFRAFLGAFYLYSLRYEVSFNSFMKGFWTYSVDLIGPMQVIFRLIFKRERFDNRRLWYGIVGCVLIYYEFSKAIEFTVFRIIFTMIDKGIVRSHYGSAIHYLEYNVDFMQSAFPHEGALPWISMDCLTSLAKHVHELRVDLGERTVKGVGFVLSIGGHHRLMTVNHVVRGAQAMSVGGSDVAHISPSFDPVTSGDDPMVGMKYDNEDGDIPDISILRHDEIRDVGTLAFIGVDDDGERTICIVPKFTVVQNTLRAVVNLKKGDSGSPCFAVLNDGHLRLAGVVSRGSSKSGGGNIISFCYSDENLELDSDSDGYTLGNIAKFNVRRRHEALHSDGAFKYDAYKELRKLADDIDEARTFYLKVFGTLPKYKTYGEKCSVDSVLKAIDDKRDGDRDDGFDDVKDKNKKKRYRSRMQKDRAAAKRNQMTLDMTVITLKGIYKPAVVECFFDTLMTTGSGPLRCTNFVNGFVDGTVIFSDDIDVD